MGDVIVNFGLDAPLNAIMSDRDQNSVRESEIMLRYGGGPKLPEEKNDTIHSM